MLRLARELKFRYAANIEYEMDEQDPTEGVRHSFEYVKRRAVLSAYGSFSQTSSKSTVNPGTPLQTSTSFIAFVSASMVAMPCLGPASGRRAGSSACHSLLTRSAIAERMPRFS